MARAKPADIIAKISSVRIQGAREIAIASLKFLKRFAAQHGFGPAFDARAVALERTRPTAVVLHNCLELLRKQRSTKTIDLLLHKLEESKVKVATKGQKILRSGMSIMTHCHSGEALGVIKAAKLAGKRISVIATITEPKHQGIKTARELAKARIPITLITDSAVGHFMPQVDLVLVGADCLRAEGVVNKIGTRTLAMVAAAHKKPLYVAASSFKLDRRKQFEIEERPPTEIHRKLLGVKIRNPAFDLTPWRYVTAVVTEDGIFKPQQIKRALRS